MLGAIAGDIIGSVYEHNNVKTTDFQLFQPASIFTDDSVQTIALADSIIRGTNYTDKLKEYYRRHRDKRRLQGRPFASLDLCDMRSLGRGSDRPAERVVFQT